jgi:hypothetical protein
MRGADTCWPAHYMSCLSKSLSHERIFEYNTIYIEHRQVADEIKRVHRLPKQQ